MLSGCAAAELPYDLTPVTAPPAPVHPVRVAFLPLVDDRARGDGPDARTFMYNGTKYRATDLSDLAGEPTHRITEVVARHLAKSRVFAQIILVLDPSQAPEADWLMTGRVYRMRGYVEDPEEARPRRPTGRGERRRGRKPKAVLQVLSEVVLTDVTLEDAKDRDRRLFVADVGWSVLEERPVTETGPTPWEVLAETLFVAVDSLARELAAADLSGALEVRDEVALELQPTSTSAAFGELSTAPPYGWRFQEEEQSGPIGWRGEGRCTEARFVQRQSLRFHRLLGPYRPTVTLWACPSDVAFTYDTKEEFPSRFLGARNGRRYFGRTLGETNWPNALEEVTTHLSVERPPSKYVFELPATITSSGAASP